jgi:hypothetical protein
VAACWQLQHAADPARAVDVACKGQ